MPWDDMQGIGLYLHPTSGQIYVAEGLGVGLAVVCWLVALVLGLATARLVLP